MGNLLQIIENIAGYADPITIMLLILSFVIGVTMVIIALKGFAKRSEMGTSAGTWSAPVWTFVIGIAFIALPGLIASLTVSFFGAGTSPGDSSLVVSPQSIFEHAPATVGLFEAGSPARDVITGIVRVVQLVGLIAIMRGLHLLNQSAQGGHGPKTFGPGLTFVIAGALAMNFPLFVGVMEMLISAPAATPTPPATP